VGGWVGGGGAAAGTVSWCARAEKCRPNAALNGLEQRFLLLQCGANLSDPDPMLQAGFNRGQEVVVVCVCGGGGLELMGCYLRLTTSSLQC
jgi:hypothetical protein